MADSYISKRVLYNFIPGSPGVPAVAGQPYRPAFCVWESQPRTRQRWLCAGAGGEQIYRDTLGPGTTQDSASLGLGTLPVWVYNGGEVCVSVNVLEDVPVYVCYPEIPYIAPVPGVPATAAQYNSDNNLGWNAGGVSALPLIGDGMLIAYPVSSAGVIYGLVPAEETIGEHYSQIDHGFYIQQSSYAIIENGVKKTTFQAFTPGDEFGIMRVGDRILYLVDSTVVYSSTLPATAAQLYADISLYAANDRLNDAAFTSIDTRIQAAAVLSGSAAVTSTPTILQNSVLSGVGRSSMYPTVGGVHTAGAVLAGTAGITTTADVKLHLSATLEGTAGITAAPVLSYSHSAGVMAGMVGTASDGDYAFSEASLREFGGTGGQADLVPQFAQSAAVMVPLTGAGHGLTGEISVSASMTMKEFDGLAADHAYGESEGVLGYLTSYGGESNDIYGLIEPIPRPTLDATASSELPRGLAALTPVMSLQALGGAQARLTGPAMILSASGTVENWGTARLTTPRITINGSAVSDALGQAALKVPFPTLEAFSGTGLQKRMPVPTLSASGTAGQLGTLAGEVPGLQLVATGTMEARGSAELTVPSLQMVMQARAGLTIPSLTLRASAVQGASYVARVLTVNVATGKVGELDNFEFTAIGRIGESQFLFNSTGVHQYGGTQDAGAALPSSMTLHATDFKSPRDKRLPYAYINGRGDGVISVAQVLSTGAGTAQVSDNKYHTGAGNRRAKLSRKTRSRFLGLHMESATEPLFIEGIEMLVQLTDRRGR